MLTKKNKLTIKANLTLRYVIVKLNVNVNNSKLYCTVLYEYSTARLANMDLLYIPVVAYTCLYSTC